MLLSPSARNASAASSFGSRRVISAGGVGLVGRHRDRAPGAEAERIRELEARVRQLGASERKPAAERDILRKAAKYFAGETNW